MIGGSDTAPQFTRPVQDPPNIANERGRESSGTKYKNKLRCFLPPSSSSVFLPAAERLGVVSESRLMLFLRHWTLQVDDGEYDDMTARRLEG